MACDHTANILTPQTSLESVTSSDAETKDDVNESKWNRLRARLHEVTGRVKLRSTSRRNSSRYGSLLKLASEERRIHRSRHFSSQPHLNPAEDGVAGLWDVIHLLEDRVEALENALQIGRQQIDHAEEKCDVLQRKIEMLVGKQLQEPPLDADSDGNVYREKMSLCFQQIRNKQYHLKHVGTTKIVCTSEGIRASRERRKCAGCGKSAF